MNVLLLQGLSELGLDVCRAETLERFSSLLLESSGRISILPGPNPVFASMPESPFSPLPRSRWNSTVSALSFRLWATAVIRLPVSSMTF